MKLLLAVASMASLASAEISYSFLSDRSNAVAQAISSGVEVTATAAFELGASIAAPGSKDLILMLSSEVNLLTQTTVKATNTGGKTTAVAYSGMMATVKYCTDCSEATGTTVAEICAGVEDDGVYEAFPKGGIYFSARRQTLSLNVNLDCTDTCDVTGYVEVDLTLDTTAAHTFNFIADLQNTGTGSTNNPIRAVACFDLSAEASAAIGSSARGYVALGKAMFIVQEASVSNLN